jgi:hypothetical protein
VLVIKHPGAAVITTTEAKRDLPGTFKVAEKMRVYVTKDGQPIGGLVSLEMMDLLEQALAEREERRAKRANVTVRVVRRDAEPEGDTVYMTPGERIGVMRTLSRSARAVAEGADDAGA